jgi:hypothetical protein
MDRELGLVYVFSEPIEAWERYSHQLRAILSVAANLRTRKPGRSQDWQTIQQGEPPDLPPSERQNWHPHNFLKRPRGNRLLGEQLTLADAVSNWLGYGGVGVSVSWNDSESRLQTYLTYDILDTTLPGRLAVELCAMLSHGVYRCAGCGAPFTVEWEEKRRPSNRDAWCGGKECKRIQAREASRRYYRKNRHAR